MNDLDEDAEAIARWDAEEAKRKQRHEDQLLRADLAPMDPPPGTWIHESHWRKLYAGQRPTIMSFATIREAVADGLQLSCCAGILRLRVIGPDGLVHCSYDREGNYWLRHTEEAEKDDADHRASFIPGTPKLPRRTP